MTRLAGTGDVDVEAERRALYRHIGRRMAAVRHASGILQHELADATGVSVRTIGRMEAGKFMPDIWILKRLGEMAGFPVATFFLGEPDSEDQKPASEHA